MTTQTSHPWRTTLRTVFQALVAFAAMWAVVVEAAGLDPDWRWVSISLALTGAVTRVMALPQVEQFLSRFIPWLAADPHSPARHVDESGCASVRLVLVAIAGLLGGSLIGAGLRGETVPTWTLGLAFVVLGLVVSIAGIAIEDSNEAHDRLRAASPRP